MAKKYQWYEHLVADTVFGIGGFILGGPLGAAAGVLYSESMLSDRETAATAVEQKNTEDAAAIQQKKDADDLAKTNLTAANTLAKQQQLARITDLQTRQASDLATYQDQQRLQTEAQTTQEQDAYISANLQLRGAQEQMGAIKGQAVSSASGIIQEAAGRGVRIGAGTVGEAAKVASGEFATASDGTISYQPGDVFQPGNSPLAKLAAFELNAKQGITNQAQGTVGASNLATGQIKSGTEQFWNELQHNMSAFTLGQSQQLDAANLDYTQTVARMDQAETQASATFALEERFQSDIFTMNQGFTQTNLESYNSSLWLSAFTNMLGMGNSLMKDFWKPGSNSLWGES